MWIFACSVISGASSVKKEPHTLWCGVIYQMFLCFAKLRIRASAVSAK